MADRFRRWLIAAVLISIAPALAADLPLAPQAAPVEANPHQPPSPGCREWSDGCRTCQQSAGGEVSCSNVGIACVPKAATCTASDAPAR